MMAMSGSKLRRTLMPSYPVELASEGAGYLSIPQMPTTISSTALDDLPTSPHLGIEEASQGSSSWQYLNFPESGPVISESDNVLGNQDNQDMNASFPTANGQEDMFYLMENFDPLDDILSFEVPNGSEFLSQ